MIKSLVNIFIVIIFVACHPLTLTTETSSSYLQIIVNEDKSIVLGESISISIKNIHSNKIIIYYPEKLIIEKLEEGNWHKLKILECPCDAPCQASIDKIELDAGNTFEISWDQKESWCDPQMDEHIRKSIYQRVEKGQYRVRINYKTDGESDETIYKNFTL